MLHHEVRLGAELQVIVPGKPGAYAGLWKVVKVNPKNIKLQHMTEGRMLNASPTYLHLPGDVIAQPIAEVTYIPATEFLTKGQVVKAKGADFARRMPGYWVVTGTAGGKAQLSPLGGSAEGRYWSVQHNSVDVVDIDELLGLQLV